MMRDDLRSDPSDPTGGSGGGNSRPPWLPEGATLNPDGSVTLPGGQVLPAPQPGYTRDPQTGQIVRDPNSNAPPQTVPLAPPAVTPSAAGPGPSAGPGPGSYASQYQPWSGSYSAPPQLNLGGKPGLAFIPPAPTFDFKAPTAAEAMQEPGYDFSYKEGLRAIDQGAAKAGLLNSGGTLTAEQLYGQNAATANYGNVYNRAFNLAQARFSPLMTEYGTLAQAGQRENELNNSRSLDLYKQHYGEWYDWQNLDWNRKYQSATA